MDGGENVVRRQTRRTLRILWKRRTSCRVCTSFVHTNIMKTNGAQTNPAHPTDVMDGGENVVRRQALRTLQML